MDFSTASIMSELLKETIMNGRRSTYLDLLKQIIDWRWDEFQWSDLHLAIVGLYFSKLSTIYDFPELPSQKYFIDILSSSECRSSRIFAAASFTHELQQWFMVPRLNKCHESENHIKKYHLVEAFIGFLLQLLYHRTDLDIDPWKDRVDNLEKELRTLFTILGDTSLMLCADEHEESQKLLAEFEAVANEAGRLVHSLFFAIYPAFLEMNEGIGFLLNHIDLLKVNILKFLNLVPSIRRSAYITPRTSVVDSLLMVHSLIQDLEDLMKRKDNWIADAKDQIKILHQGLIFSQSSIKDIGSPQPSEIGELKEPLMQMGDMAHEAEYLITSLLSGDVPLLYFIIRLIDVNSRVGLIGIELQEIAKKYKFGDVKVAKCFSTQPSLQAKINTKVDDVTVGFEDKETHILDLLVGGGTEHLQVISIYGMPGLGKTTLAKKLYSHPLVNYHFHKLSWCVISQIYQRQSILADILIHLKSEQGKDSILKMDEESLVEHIYKTLKGRRYLVVMDDIWDSYVWDNLRRCFPDDGNGSRILFTTRNKDVAPPDSITYALPSLSNDQCWELLKIKVFDNESFPPELLRIGKKIAANCRGLPLAVVVISGILSTVDKEKSEWEEVGGNLASYILDGGDNLMTQILDLSYKHLPDHLKPCFLYLGAFQEDEEIHVKKLMRLWIAEGFIRKEDGKSAENVAEEYLMELIDKSLVMVSKRRSNGGAKTCVIHDLFHDLCLKRSEEENFMKFVKSNIFSICQKSHRVRAFEHPINLHYCQQVRSFRCNCLECGLYVHKMRSLRVLHFDFCDYYGHYIGIEYLVNLRYLVIAHLPPSIDNLVNLEYLCVNTWHIVYISSTIMKMKKLRYIRGDKVQYDPDCNTSRTNNLEFLDRIIIRNLKDEEMLKCSPHLRKLKCKYEEKRANTYPNYDLRFFTQLDSLNLACHSFHQSKKLEEIRFPSNIRKLTLTGGDRFCVHCTCEGMSIIGRLEKLEVLKLIRIAFKGERWDTRDGEFQKLTFLKLDVISSLSEWNVVSSQHFPRLQQLVLRYCYKLQEIPSEIGEIPTLQLIEIKGLCTKSLVESAERIQQQQLDLGNEDLRVITSDSLYICESSSKEEDAQTFNEKDSFDSKDDNEGEDDNDIDKKGEDDDNIDGEDEKGSTSTSNGSNEALTMKSSSYNVS